LQIPEVDFSRVQSNDIVEILNVLGIEATRKALLFHVRMVISFDGSYVNYRHLGTLCDVMTQRGHLMAITRHGVNRTNLGPLMKCSFEETVEILMDSAIYAETDYMRAVSENCMFGQTAPIGTGVFDLYMDDQLVEEDDGNKCCALDFATPTLPHLKGLDLFASPSAATPLVGTIPATSPYDQELKMASPTPDQERTADLPTPAATPGDEDAALGRLAARTPFSPMGGGTPFSQPSAGRSPASDMSSPATPNEESSQFRSPSYTPADASPTGTSDGNDVFSPTYDSMMSPAYTPDASSYQPSRPEDATSSPSYHSVADRGSSNYKMDYSPTSWSGADHQTSDYAAPAQGRRAVQPFSPTSQAYSPMVSSPAAGRAFDPTSPVDSPMQGGGFTSPHGMSPMGEPGSPILQPHHGAGQDSPYQVDVQSPSYTPQPGRREDEGVEGYQQVDPGGADLISNEGDSDDDGMDMFDHDEAPTEEGY